MADETGLSRACVFLSQMAQRVFVLTVPASKTPYGSFNNYMDKKRGRVGSAKSPRLSTQGGGGPMNVHVDQNLAISESMSYVLLCSVMGGKKEMKLH